MDNLTKGQKIKAKKNLFNHDSTGAMRGMIKKGQVGEIYSVDAGKVDLLFNDEITSTKISNFNEKFEVIDD